MGIVVAVMGFKGGVGKTTVACTLAAGGARAGLSTLLIEADAQGNASHLVNVEPYEGFYGLIIDQASWDAVVSPVPLDFHGEGELYIVPASSLQHIVESHDETPGRVHARMQEARQLADLVIVDTSPGRTQVHAGMFHSADYLLLPTGCDMVSMKSLETTLEHFDQARENAKRYNSPVATILGIIPNRFRASEDVQQSNLATLNDMFAREHHVYSLIRDLTVWRQAAQARQSIFTFSPDNRPYARQQARSARREFEPVLESVLALTRTAV